MKRCGVENSCGIDSASGPVMKVINRPTHSIRNTIFEAYCIFGGSKAKKLSDQS